MLDLNDEQFVFNLKESTLQWKHISKLSRFYTAGLGHKWVKRKQEKPSNDRNSHEQT